jgi:hypothetical protein
MVSLQKCVKVGPRAIQGTLKTKMQGTLNVVLTHGTLFSLFVASCMIWLLFSFLMAARFSFCIRGFVHSHFQELVDEEITQFGFCRFGSFFFECMGIKVQRCVLQCREICIERLCLLPGCIHWENVCGGSCSTRTIVVISDIAAWIDE